ncbi:uncharacterized protein LOC109793223 [Cajanus cajan]|uniref:uncharacterized protein LOC109793223 n=1 Tax=Cajanus cajan TaxID=3821 RepID=UPI00098D7ADA|nr:uncharacterized protein LOC109793223 [Cajanus cajan]
MEEGMQCTNIKHPHRNNPAAICAFCLQEKLRNLHSPPSTSSLNPNNVNTPTTKRNAFWSFIYPSSKPKPKPKPKPKCSTSQEDTSLVSRSRSVGCGTRTFSRDCTLRRVQSQRHAHDAIAGGRTWAWAWAFASPIRAFTTKASSKRDNNLSSIPSLLAVR